MKILKSPLLCSLPRNKLEKFLKENVIQEAKAFAYLMHQGQKRKDGKPYIVHLEGVVRILEEVVFETWPDSDPPEDYDVILSTGWLHDVLEDTPVTYNQLKIHFGRDIVGGVYLLSRNIGREEYKLRIEGSDYTVKIIKLADTLHNICNPYSLSYLPPTSIQRKLDDCESFYIPLAMEVCPNLGYKLKESVDNYLKFSGGNEK